MKWIPFAVDVKTGTNHRVFVQRAPKLTQLNGIDIPDSAQQNQHYGTVIGTSSPNLHVGDVVLYSRMGGMDINVHGDPEFTVFDEAEILAVQDKEQQ